MYEKIEAGEYEEALKVFEAGSASAAGLTLQQLKFNEAVCYEYLGRYDKALQLFESYVEEFGSDEKAEHEIAFLVTR
jgi:tetratricopeptide (TPR) repeat protein